MTSIQKQDKKWIDYCVFGAEHFRKCIRAGYFAAIIDQYGRMVGHGWNGKPAKSICDSVCFRVNLGPGEDAKTACCVHAEINCLLNTPREFRFGGTIYISGIPCEPCLVAVLNSNLQRLVFLNREATSGHAYGNSVGALFRRYGIDMEYTEYTEYEWQVLYGEGDDEELRSNL